MIETISLHNPNSNRAKTLKEADLTDIFDELMLRFHSESISIEVGDIYYDGTRDFLIRIRNGYIETMKGETDEEADDKTN